MKAIRLHTMTVKAMKPKVVVKIRKSHPDFAVPEYKTSGAAGCDVCAAENGTVLTGTYRLVSTGLFLEIPEGYECQIRPRSGLALKHGVTVLNSPGTLDSDYRGELMVLLYNAGPWAYKFVTGDRIAQLVFAPVTRVEFETVDELSETERSHGGFGSTGK